MAIAVEGNTSERDPKNSIKIFYLFLTIQNCTTKCKVIRKRKSQGAEYGFEIPVQYKFTGTEKNVEWEKKITRRVTDSAENRTKSLTVQRIGLRVALNNNFSLGEINVYFFHENCLPTPCVHFTKSHFRGKSHLMQENNVSALQRTFHESVTVNLP